MDFRHSDYPGYLINETTYEK
jgi:hypothetical protein